MTLAHWLPFAIASAILVAIPGPTVLLVISYALGHGRRFAMVTTAGVALGDLTSMTASMLGLGVILAASATLFTPGPDWHAIGTGDFNGDGMADILLQATSGASNGTPLLWEMNGTSIIASATLSNPGSAWKAIGTEDFNGDGNADILFQNGDGHLADECVQPDGAKPGRGQSGSELAGDRGRRLQRRRHV